ncbi:MAG TPA: WD40 repeat domain-containing protein, partial [Candidatus Xenobia bacterium]
FSPDEGTLVVGVGEKRLVAYTLEGERRWIFGLDEVPRPVRFSADSRVVGVALPDGHGIDLLETATGKLVNAVTSKGHLNDYAFAPQGDRLALSWDDGRLQICHADGRPDGVWACAGPPGRLAWAPDGWRLLVGVGDKVQLLSMGQSEAVYATDRWHLSPVSWSPGGTHFALDHFRAPNRFGVSLRELPDGRIMRYDETQDHVSVDWSPDNHLLAVATDRVRVYRLVDGEEAYSAPDVGSRQAWFAAHGHRMAVWTWDGSIRIWDF